MSDSSGLEPPAKKARIEVPSNDSLDATGSPIDDGDDDFYDTSPVKPVPSVAHPDAVASDSSPAAAPSSASLSSHGLPGLGSLATSSNGPASTAPINSTEVLTGVGNDGDVQGGELSESGSLYHGAEVSTTVPELDDQQAAEATAATELEEALSAALAGDDFLPRDAGPPLESFTANAPAKTLVTPDRSADVNAVGSAGVAIGSAATGEGVTDGIGSEAEFQQAAEANKGNPSAEWELDSDAESSSASSSSGNSEADNSAAENDSEDGELLDPEEQVRRLMMESADETGTAAKAKVKTLNETAEEYEKPDITVTEHTKITELGRVESIVDELVVIKANVSGNYQVLEAGSALCLGNRTVIGQVAETLGRILEPRYSLGFADATEISTLEIEKDTRVFYVDEHSRFVYTDPLKAQKFSDASNLHDEETGEVEFSDDEKEADFKRKQKGAKKVKSEANREPEAPAPTPRSGHVDAPVISQPTHYQGGGLKYSDDEDEDLGMYRPLARPNHYEDYVGAGAPIEDRSHVRRGAMRGRGGWPDRGRGSRGRGGGPPGRGRGFEQNRFGRGPDRPDRGGRHQEQNHPRNAPQAEKRPPPSASPPRQDHGRRNDQSSPARGHLTKRQRRQERQRERQQQRQQNRQQERQSDRPHASPPASAPTGPASSNTSGYAQNNAIHTTGWSMPNAAPAYQPPNPYAASSTPPNPYIAQATPPVPAGSYANPAYYNVQQPVVQDPQQQQQQQTMQQWIQWAQLFAAANQNQGHAQQPVAAAPPPTPAPTLDPRQHHHQRNSNNNSNNQGAMQSLQDILRTLGSASRPS